MNLKIEKLSFKYNKDYIIEDLNYTFESNTIYGLFGKNGIGKTTLLNILKGRYTYLGNIKLNDNLLLSKDVTFITSTPELPDFLTGEEYIKYLMKINNCYDKDKVDEYFNMVNLSNDSKDKLLMEYSHGMKNKIEILTSIILDSKIILLDEPLTNLDIVAQEEIKEILNKLKNDKIIIISTHILDIASSLCDEVLILKNKKIYKISNDRENIIMNLQNI